MLNKKIDLLTPVVHRKGAALSMNNGIKKWLRAIWYTNPVVREDRGWTRTQSGSSPGPMNNGVSISNCSQTAAQTIFTNTKSEDNKIWILQMRGLDIMFYKCFEALY